MTELTLIQRKRIAQQISGQWEKSQLELIETARSLVGYHGEELDLIRAEAEKFGFQNNLDSWTRIMLYKDELESSGTAVPRKPTVDELTDILIEYRTTNPKAVEQIVHEFGYLWYSGENRTEPKEHS